MKHCKQEYNRDTYRTGSTNPPKSHYGLIAVLLILVTVLSSIVTVLGMMNIRLWNLVKSQDQQELDYSQQEQVAVAEASGQLVFSQENSEVLGMTCQEISGLYRSYNGWPNGLYISQVEPGSAAAQGEIQPGDILVAVNGTAVSSRQELVQAAENWSSGTQLTLILFREEKQITVTLTAE